MATRYDPSRVWFGASTLGRGCTNGLIVAEKQDIPALHAIKTVHKEALEDSEGFQWHDLRRPVLQACHHSTPSPGPPLQKVPN